MNRTSSTHRATTGMRRGLPLYVWILTGIGAVVGAFLAEPGNLIGNTIPSSATFAVAGFVLGVLVRWIQVMVTRRAVDEG